MGHTAERCKLRSSHRDKAVIIGEQNAIVAEVMNISRRTHPPKALAPKRGGARGGVADLLPAHPSGPPAGGSPAHGTKAVILPHVRFNKKTGKYVQRHLQSACNMDISVKFDPDHCNLLRREYRIPELDTNTVHNQALFPARKTAAIADTGASVDCSGIERYYRPPQYCGRQTSRG